MNLTNSDIIVFNSINDNNITNNIRTIIKWNKLLDYLLNIIK